MVPTVYGTSNDLGVMFSFTINIPESFLNNLPLPVPLLTTCICDVYITEKRSQVNDNLEVSRYRAVQN